MSIDVQRIDDLSVTEFQAVLRSSGLAARRPIDDGERLARMLKHSNLIIIARHEDQIIGVARSVTDFSYCCYMSDLAVDVRYQGRGIGKLLIERTRELAGPESMCLLLSSPDAMPFYKAIGMSQPENAFLYKRER